MKKSRGSGRCSLFISLSSLPEISDYHKASISPSSSSCRKKLDHQNFSTFESEQKCRMRGRKIESTKEEVQIKRPGRGFDHLMNANFSLSSLSLSLSFPSPVCTDAIKLQPPILLSPWRSFSKPSGPCGAIARGAGRRSCGSLKVTARDSASTEAVADDYYAVLGLLPDASPEQIKKAYYNCMKECHPDLSGDDPDTTNFCMFINEVYEVLSDPVQRMVYDEIHGYALTAINPFFDDSSTKDLAFVDEFSCIGCKSCANVAPDVFGIEEDFGRARVYNQCGNQQRVQEAIDSCPVDCIHWTSAAQLSLLEDEMRRVERVNVAFMLSGMGSSAVDVFRLASSRWEKRQSKVLEQAKVRMTKKKSSDGDDSYWSNLWGSSPKDQRNSEEETNERAKRAAAAARRWREYSRRGVDKPPTFKLPESISSNDN